MTVIVRACQFDDDGTLAAYALGILDDAERVAFEAHLAECPTCPDEVAAYRAAMADLPLAYDEIVDTPAPVALRERILDAARAEREPSVPLVPPIAEQVETAPSEAESSGGGGGLPADDPVRGPLKLFPPRFLMLSLAAALAVLLGASLLVRLATNGGPGATMTPATTTYTLGSGGTARGQASYSAGSRQLSLTLVGLPPLGSEQLYQLWIARPAGLQSANVFRLDDGAGMLGVPLDLEDANALYITIEPAPNGSLAPSSPAVVAGFIGRSPAPAVVPTLPCVVGAASLCGGSLQTPATSVPTSTAIPTVSASATVPLVVPPTNTSAPAPTSVPVVPTTGPVLPTAPVAPIVPTAVATAVPPVVIPTAIPEAPPPVPPTAAPIVPPTPTPVPPPAPTPVPPVDPPAPPPPVPATSVPLPLPATSVPPPTVPVTPPAPSATPIPPTPAPAPGSTPVPTPPQPSAPPTPGGDPAPTPVPPQPTPIIPLPPLPPVPTVPPILPTIPPILPTLPPILPTLPPILPTLPPILPTLPPILPTLPPILPTLPPILPTLPPILPTLPPILPTIPLPLPLPLPGVDGPTYPSVNSPFDY